MNITVTDKAQEELRKIIDKKNSDNKDVRVYIAGVG
ncbi:Fe-S cluster assembly iron-binding protein IscA [Brassicibacter mesophilus]|jgi:Fe-S cluster assembly iron-binding protein IscA